MRNRTWRSAARPSASNGELARCPDGPRGQAADSASASRYCRMAFRLRTGRPRSPWPARSRHRPRRAARGRRWCAASWAAWAGVVGVEQLQRRGDPAVQQPAPRRADPLRGTRCRGAGRGRSRSWGQACSWTIRRRHSSSTASSMMSLSRSLASVSSSRVKSRPITAASSATARAGETCWPIRPAAPRGTGALAGRNHERRRPPGRRAWAGRAPWRAGG